MFGRNGPDGQVASRQSFSRFDYTRHSLACLTLDFIPDERYRTTWLYIQVGMTSLMLACRLGRESMVDMLVSVFGTEIDPADKVRRRQQQQEPRSIAHTSELVLQPRAPPYPAPPQPCFLQTSVQDCCEQARAAWPFRNNPELKLSCHLLALERRQKRFRCLAAWQAGWTCLFYATYHNEANIVQYLLMHGADLDQKDNQGMAAIDWGEHMGFGETCAVFSSFESQLAP